jgi:uncharacterized protein Gcw-chp
MKTFLLPIFALAIATSANGADLKKTHDAPESAWDIGFGGAWMTDYNIRGVSQSAHKPSIAAYVEPRYAIDPTLQLYAGLYGAGIDFPNRAAAQIVLSGGLRPTFGKLSFDFGVWYVYYPGGSTFDGLGSTATCTNGAFFFGSCNTMKGNVSFWELYAKPSYILNDLLTLGGNVYYSPSVLNSGAPGTYASVTGKLAVPSSKLPKDIGVFVSGELGRYWFGTTDPFYGVPAFPAGIKLPDYTTWNVGLGIGYKLYTLDLRYYGTDLSKTNCNVQTGDHTATFGGASAVTPINPSGLVSNWCSPAFIAKISLDATPAALK